jgi:hypothetical protein
MTMAARFGAAIIVLLLAIAPSHAGSCQDSIDRVQAQLDAIIAKRAGQGPWMPESIDALRGRQPTPRSIAAAEGAGNGSRLQRALNALEQPACHCFTSLAYGAQGSYSLDPHAEACPTV